MNTAILYGSFSIVVGLLASLKRIEQDERNLCERGIPLAMADRFYGVFDTEGNVVGRGCRYPSSEGRCCHYLDLSDNLLTVCYIENDNRVRRLKSRSYI